MSDPLAFLLTWTTYGSWTRGDSRGWVKKGESGIKAEDVPLNARAGADQKETTLLLDEKQRHVVDTTIRDHCKFRGWTLHAINVRTNHVHVVVTADRDPDDVMTQFKAWCSRKLKVTDSERERWWTKGGSTKWINDEAYLANAIRYVLERQ
ncbi:MAG: transposase [Planctomycetes bacterium]|nr:transposase [Planctomycetota bacterium]